MPLNKLISLLAEAEVRKLSQKRETKEPTPDAMRTPYARGLAFARQFLTLAKRFPNPARLRRRQEPEELRR